MNVRNITLKKPMEFLPLEKAILFFLKSNRFC